MKAITNSSSSAIYSQQQNSYQQRATPSSMDLMQSDSDRYKMVSKTTESSSSELVSGTRKVEEIKTTERIVSQKLRGNLLDLRV